MLLFAEMDLDPIKVKLMDPEEGQGWNRETVDRIEIAYRRFLYLSTSHPGESICPSKEIDLFWHQHILDTRKYAEDCQAFFGYFLHHFPYFGMRMPKHSKPGSSERLSFMNQRSANHTSARCKSVGKPANTIAASLVAIVLKRPGRHSQWHKDGRIHQQIKSIH